MKIIDYVRSASPAATRLRITLVLGTIALYCCNPVKKVIKDPVKTQKVVDYYIRTSPLKIDTVWNYKPGDTVTQLLIGYDTTIVRDTVNRRDTVRITERTVKTVTRVDTVERRIDGGPLLQACQKSLLLKEAELQTARGQAADAKVSAAGWRLKFWGTIGGLIIMILALLIYKLGRR